LSDYESFYREFESPLMRQIRREAYGEDIGQHSWVSADEVRVDISRLQLVPTSRLIDLGCGPAGPLTFILSLVRCRGTGVEVSDAALRVARLRAKSLGVDALLSLAQADINDPLPFPAETFDAAISVDVILHLRDRAKFLKEAARVLRPGGRLLFTDAGVLTGTMSNDEVRRRSVHGDTHFVAPGENEKLIASVGLRLVETENRTATSLANASGRLAALQAHRAELEPQLGTVLTNQLDYLETVAELARRGALSRMMYLSEKH
jgi:SAM-dependent methyltransferase